MAELIEFVAEIVKVQQLQNTMAVRVTIDLPESETLIMAQLAECRRQGAVLQIKAEPIIRQSLTDFDHETEKGTEGSASGVDSRRLDLRRSK